MDAIGDLIDSERGKFSALGRAILRSYASEKSGNVSERAAIELARLRAIEKAAEALFQACAKLAFSDDYHFIEKQVNALSEALKEAE